MDEQSEDQEGIINPLSPIQAPSYGFPAYQSNRMMDTNLVMPGQSAAFPMNPTQLPQNQPSYQQIHQQQAQMLESQLKMFWRNQFHDISEVRDFKNHSLPLARIKKIMKADEDVRMIAAEAPVLFAKACEMFILELTLRSWGHTEENKRRTLQKNDIAAAITRTEAFDFLVDIVPRDEVKEESSLSAATAGVANEPLPYYFPQQMVSSGMMMGKPVVDQGLLYTPPPQTFAPQPWPEEQQLPYEQGSTTDS